MLLAPEFMVDADLAAEDETDDTVVFGGKISSTDGKVGFSVAGILRCPVSWCDGGETGKEDMPLSESVDMECPELETFSE